MADDVTLTIDGVKVTVPKGTLLVEAAKIAQTPEIPVYCYHPKMGPAGLCRVCLVEVVGMPKLQIACYTPAADGMVVHTINERASEGRRAIMEMFLLNHPLDCPICDKGGECSLQDFTVAYGQDASRMAEPKESKPKAVDLGPTIVLDEERCIVCQRCVRFEQLISHEHGLVVKDRGSHDIIATASTKEYRSDFSGNVTELCPVGALTSKTYRFKSRPWDNHITASSCAQCSVGCSLTVHVRHEQITRTMSVETDSVSDGWLCDRGRYSVGYIRSEERLRTPMYRHNGTLIQVSWDDAITLWADALKAVDDPRKIAALSGGTLTNEENYLYQHIMRSLGVANLDWRVGRQRQVQVGHDAGTLEELEQSQAILVLGLPPSQTAPVFDLRIRKAVTRQGATLISVGPFGAGSFVPERRCMELDAALDALPNDLKRIALVWDGIDPVRGYELERFGAELSMRGVTVRRYIAPESANGRGAEEMGMHPHYAPQYKEAPTTGLDCDGIFAKAREKQLAVLSILGANPVLFGADAGYVRSALTAIPFLVVSELFPTLTTEYASLILPAASAYERSGHFTNLTGQIRPIHAAIDGPSGVLSDGDMLVALAEQLDLSLPSHQDVAMVASRCTPQGRLESFNFGDERLCGKTTGMRSKGVDAELRVAIGRAIFAGSGTLAHDERLENLRLKPRATFSLTTARKFGLSAGAEIDLRAGTRNVNNLTVIVDPTLAEGWVAILDGLVEAPANIFHPGEPISIENIRSEQTLVGMSA